MEVVADEFFVEKIIMADNKSKSVNVLRIGISTSLLGWSSFLVLIKIDIIIQNVNIYAIFF